MGHDSYTWRPAMAIEDEEVAALRRLGLTDYEARAYLVLAKTGPQKASEISFKGRVPRTKTYGAMKELERKGLVHAIPDKPEVYEVVSPNDVLFPLVERLNKEVRACDEMVHSLALSYESSRIVRRELPELGKEFWLIKERGKLYERLGKLFDEARHSIDIMTTANGLVRAYKVHSEPFEHAKRRGVRVRLIAPSTSETRPVAKELAEILELRQINEPLPAQYAAADSGEMVLMESQPDDLKTDRGADIGVWTTNKTVVNFHKALFEFVWLHLAEGRPGTQELSKHR